MSALSIDNLTKVYKNGLIALSDVSLTVTHGDFFGLLGPNGAGKSTTIGIISSLIKKTSGRVSIFGMDIDVHFLAAKLQLGVVPQEINFNYFLSPWNILLDQAGFYGVPRRIAKVRAEHYLKKLGLWKYAKNESRQLSGGMKRRLMIARALLHEPKLLILDEPTAGVDIELRRHMWDFLRDLNSQGITIILTTHYLEEAESLCKNIAIINHGKIIVTGPTKSLLEQLHKTTFVLDLAAALPAAPHIPGLAIRLTDPTTLEIDVSNTETLNVIFDKLSQANIAITSMRNKTNRLEELFVHLTSHEEPTT